MKLEVLHVPDCPNLPPLLERLARITDLPVVTRVISTDADAARFGMAGSPTLLVDGVDPFAADGGCECGVSCRLYRDSAGRIVAAPSIEQIQDILGHADPRTTKVIYVDVAEELQREAVDKLGFLFAEPEG